MKLFAASSILAALTISHYSQAGTIFSPEQIISEVVGIDRPASTFSADLDGDGDQDLLVASYGDHRIGWFEYDADSETFGEIKDIDRNILDSAVITAGDFDNDGDEDVVAWSQRTGELFSYENLGGHFGNRSVIATISSVSAITVCDLNGDGSLDLFVNDGGLFLEGTGEIGNFLEPQNLFGASYWNANVILVDFDADGKDDFLYVSGSDIVWARTINAPDQLDEPVVLRPLDSPTFFDVIDVDNDGDFDIVFADRHNGGSGHLYWMERIDGTNLFEDVVQIGNLDIGGTRWYAFADIDRDGNQDALISSVRSNTIYVYPFQAGSFAAEPSATLNHRHLSSLQPTLVTVDGYPELIATSKITRSISWYKNNSGTLDSDPTFIVKAPLSPNGTEDFNLLASIDIDNDGDLDLLYMEQIGFRNLVWLSNEGPLNGFGPPQNLTSPARSHQFLPKVLDFDGDGFMDVLAGIGWYDLSEPGEPIFNEFNLISERVYAADMDGDGDLDLISRITGSDDQAFWYPVENGEVLVNEAVEIPSEVLGSSFVDVVDLNGDGLGDLLTLTDRLRFTDFSYVLAGDGGTTFSSPVILPAATSASNIQVEDIDRDGDPDIILKSGDSTTRIRILENTDGQANFQLAAEIDAINETSSQFDLYDIDTDGDKDLILATPTGIKTLMNLDGSFNFSVKMDLLRHQLAQRFLFADISGDGKDELILTRTEPTQITAFVNTGGTNFNRDQLIYGIPEQRGLWEVIAVDIDNDGDQDVISASNGNGAISLFEQTYGEGFALPRFLREISGASDVVSGDFDGDGNTDAIASGFYGPTVYFQKEPDDLAFDASPESDLQGSNGIDGKTGQMAVGHIDSDDHLDIVSASVLIRWFTYTSELQFTEMGEIDTGGIGALSVAIADLDGDGDGDIVSSLNDGRIVWYENLDGTGTFDEEEPKIIAINLATPTSIVAVDIDNDGDLDIVSASTYDDTIAWYPNVGGEGNFGERIVISTSAIQATKVTAADMDMDGDMDLLSSSLWDHRIVYYENLDGMGNFDEGLTLTNQAYGAQTVTTADMDGDGDPDVLYGSRFNDTIAWFPNRISELKPIIEVILGMRDADSGNSINEDSVIDAADLAKLRNAE